MMRAPISCVATCPSAAPQSLHTPPGLDPDTPARATPGTVSPSTGHHCLANDCSPVGFCFPYAVDNDVNLVQRARVLGTLVTQTSEAECLIRVCFCSPHP